MQKEIADCLPGQPEATEDKDEYASAILKPFDKIENRQRRRW